MVEESLALDKQEQVKGEHRAVTSSTAKVAQLPLKSKSRRISKPRASRVSVSCCQQRCVTPVCSALTSKDRPAHSL